MHFSFFLFTCGKRYLENLVQSRFKQEKETDNAKRIKTSKNKNNNNCHSSRSCLDGVTEFEHCKCHFVWLLTPVDDEKDDDDDDVAALTQ